MTRLDGPDEEIWGTREELLLACAVSRHGTRSWESVAMEVQTRSPFPHLLTARSCRERYHNLQRRFAAEYHGIDVGGAPCGADSGANSLLEELKNLRVAELRREVQRRDVSIVCLQLKVKRLEEDRERSLHDEQSGDKPDPSETRGVKKEAESPTCSPENPAVDRVSGEDSRRSCNESNSMEPKESWDPRVADDGKLDGATAGAGNHAVKADPASGDDEKLAGEGSYNGSSDTVARGMEAAKPGCDPAAKNPAREPDAGEFGESVAESKGEASKESSDVQSSASLSRRRGGRTKAAADSGGSSGEEEVEADKASQVASKGSAAAKSHPLGSFLQIIRTHECGSMLERRLEAQDSERYRSLIRQHMDLGTVHSKVEQSAYASDVEFYRDLLLLCTNAVVFFPRNSTEHRAAVQLRELVRMHIPTKIQKPVPTSSAVAEESTAAPPPPSTLARQSVVPKAKPEPDPSGWLLDKPISAPPLLACRERSSISGKAAAKVSAAAKEEEKPDPDKKEPENMEKKMTKERSAVVGVRGLRTTKVRGGSGGGGANKNSASNSVPASTENAVGTARTERGNNGGNAANSPAVSVAKKRSAVNFLTRMNRGAASHNGSLLETLKNSGTGGKAAGGDQRKGGRTDGRKDQGPKRGSGVTGPSGKQAQEQSDPVKRVGRPPKRPPPPRPSPPAKRAKAVETRLAAASRAAAAAAKKRGRRLRN